MLLGFHCITRGSFLLKYVSHKEQQDENFTTSSRLKRLIQVQPKPLNLQAYKEKNWK
jgi:hypothetical protein